MTEFAFRAPAPYGHQLHGLKLLHKYDGTFGLLYDVGVGKSRIVLDYLGQLAHHFRSEIRVLVCAPRSVQDTWGLQVGLYGSESVAWNVAVLEGSIEAKQAQLAGAGGLGATTGGGEVRLVVVNYEALSSRRARGSKLDSDRWLAAVKDFAPHVLVCDESQRCKSNTSNVSRLLHRIAPTVKRRILLTGTPMPHALTLDSPVLTPTGWVPMGEIEQGQLVVGSNGQPTEVVGVWPQGLCPIYRVSFSDDSFTLCTSEHLWQVTTRGRRSRGLAPKVLRTDCLGDLTYENGSPRWTVPTVSSVQFAKQKVPVDPYTLGLLLGDGHLGHPVDFTTMDLEIVEFVQSALPEGLQLTVTSGQHGSRASRYRITSGMRGGSLPGKKRGPRPNPLHAALDGLKLRGVTGPDKFVPAVYLWNDEETRLAVLRGLMDSDGTGKGGSTSCFTTTSPQLARDVKHLVQSLGGYVTSRAEYKPPQIMPQGHTSCARPQYVLSFGLSVNPFRLSRKASLWSPRTRVKERAIVSVVPVGKLPAQCITVAAEDGLFVTQHFVVTHNSPLDIYSQFKILDPQVFWSGTKPMTFAQFEAKVAVMGGYLGKQIMGWKNLDWLEARMAQRSHAMPKSECLDLPPVTHVDVPVRLSDREQKAYDKIKKEMVLALADGEMMSAPSMLVLRLRLRQLTCGFAKEDDTGEIQWLGHSRVDSAVDLIQTLLESQDRVVVFGWALAEIKLLKERLGDVAHLITGATSDAERISLRQQFGDTKKHPQKMVLVAQWRTISLGINELVTASHGVVMSLTQQREDILQAIGRLDRPGQTEPVTFHWLQVRGSVDTVIQQSHLEKTDLEQGLLKYLRESK